mgnify:CR=1 FL=1
MQVLLDVLIPVFLIVAFGYVSVWIRLFDNSLIEALVEFTQNFAIPILLLKGMSLTVALFSLGGILYRCRPEAIWCNFHDISPFAFVVPCLCLDIRKKL